VELGLEGKRAIVTGASRGIGAAVAHALAAEGCRVGLVARTGEDLDEQASSIIAAGGPLPVVSVADLATADGVRLGIAACIEGLDGVDILVNNAGASPFGTIDQLSDEQWQAAFDLKLMGYLRCMREVLAPMRAQRSGRIVNIGGVAGMRASSGYALAALNAALIHLTRSTAELVGPDGINVISLHPGPTMTDRILTLFAPAAARAGMEPEDYARQVVAKDIPVGRLATPEEVAAGVVFAVSDRAAMVTGGGLSIDGGTARGLVGG
jgi:3-oxoacyl-[acyl-carrier protein] reductase